jgi:ubiquinone/menaquinone biosynthesis C-methylase UbiE
MVDGGSAISSAIDLVRHLWPERSRLLDAGCGSGDFVRTLIEFGHDAEGCDPQAERIAEARVKVPSASFTISGAETLPYPDRSFDGVLMLQSLHHVPGELMENALVEALRCIRPRGFLAVIEPVAEGSFFEMLRIIDDETEVRAKAQEAMKSACRKGILKRHVTHNWPRRDTYASAGQVIEKLLANDPARATAIAKNRSLLESAFVRFGEPSSDGRILLHLTRADVFVA